MKWKDRTEPVLPLDMTVSVVLSLVINVNRHVWGRSGHAVHMIHESCEVYLNDSNWRSKLASGAISSNEQEDKTQPWDAAKPMTWRNGILSSMTDWNETIMKVWKEAVLASHSHDSLPLLLSISVSPDVICHAFFDGAATWMWFQDDPNFRESIFGEKKCSPCNKGNMVLCSCTGDWMTKERTSCPPRFLSWQQMELLPCNNYQGKRRCDLTALIYCHKRFALKFCRGQREAFAI